MRPVADQNKISCEKLAYIIDATAVSSSLPDASSIDGFRLFMKTIFCNYYSWFSLGMIFLTIMLQLDFAKMRAYEKAAMDGISKKEYENKEIN